MSNISQNTVSHKEAEALKEMIFRRVKERAENIAEESQNKYTSSIKYEIMDIARESFMESKNPFSIKPTQQNETIKEVPKESKTSEQEIAENKANPSRLTAEDIEKLKKQVEQGHQALREYLAENEVSYNMEETANSLRTKKSFVGALEFLNAKTTQSMINSKRNGFEAIA